MVDDILPKEMSDQLITQLIYYRDGYIGGSGTRPTVRAVSARNPRLDLYREQRCVRAQQIAPYLYQVIVDYCLTTGWSLEPGWDQRFISHEIPTLIVNLLHSKKPLFPSHKNKKQFSQTLLRNVNLLIIKPQAGTVSTELYLMIAVTIIRSPKYEMTYSMVLTCLVAVCRSWRGRRVQVALALAPARWG